MLKEIKISDIQYDHVHRKDLGDIRAFAENIARTGLLQPILVRPDMRLVCGRRRIEAHKILERETIMAYVVDIKNLLFAEASENSQRKQWAVSEAVAIASEIEKDYSTGRGGDRKTKTFSDQVHDRALEITESRPNISLDGKKIRDIAAEVAGFSSHETYRKAKIVVNDGCKDLIDAVDKGRVSIDAASEIARLPKKEQVKEIEKGELELIATAKKLRELRSGESRRKRIKKAIKKPSRTIDPRTQYSIIYVAPPWYRVLDEIPPTGEDAISLNDLKALPVADLAMPASMVFILAPGPRLADALECMGQWGFAYTDNYVIDTIHPYHTTHIRTLRHLHLLVGMSHTDFRQTPVDTIRKVKTSRDGTTSSTPYELIEEVFSTEPNLRKLDMFPTAKRKGWHRWNGSAE